MQDEHAAHIRLRELKCVDFRRHATRKHRQARGLQLERELVASATQPVFEREVGTERNETIVAGACSKPSEAARSYHRAAARFDVGFNANGGTSMKRLSRFASAATLALIMLVPANAQEWVTLFDGTNLNNFNAVGTANWKVGDGMVEATSGNGFLVSKDSYSNFELRVEFWVDEGGNSGVYMRCQDAAKIQDTTCYEANVFDKRPDQWDGPARSSTSPNRWRSSTPVGNGTRRSPRKDRS